MCPGWTPYRSGAPEGIRTPDPQIRSLVLYPAELPALHEMGLAAAPGFYKRELPQMRGSTFAAGGNPCYPYARHRQGHNAEKCEAVFGRHHALTY